MKMIDHTPGRKPKRVDLIGLFKRRDVIGGLDERAPCRGVWAERLGGDLSPCIKIVPIGFALVWIRVEDAVRIQMCRAIRKSLVTGPLDSGPAGQFGVAHPTVITGPSL